MSEEDIRAGTNWSERIKRELANTTVGIVCMTPENQNAKWINFEMGALSKEVKDGDSRVIPLLIGFDNTQQVSQPAASLNMVLLGQAGFNKIATSLNDISDVKREKADLEMVSNTWWTMIKDGLEAAAAQTPDDQAVNRPPEAMIAEILDAVRDIQKQGKSRGVSLTSGTYGRGVEESFRGLSPREDDRIRQELTSHLMNEISRYLHSLGNPGSVSITPHGALNVTTVGPLDDLQKNEIFEISLKYTSIVSATLIDDDPYVLDMAKVESE
ncbi:TIR domain-containing protein [Arthrobacter sp. ok909]|nr:TIR domain-containing protein [Arthrobacter sp. ok909]